MPVKINYSEGGEFKTLIGESLHHSIFSKKFYLKAKNGQTLKDLEINQIISVWGA